MCLLRLRHQIIFEPEYDKTNKITYAPSEDSYQPGHPPCLISLRCAPFWIAWDPNFLQADSEDWSDISPVWSVSSLDGACVISLVLSRINYFEESRSTFAFIIQQTLNIIRYSEITYGRFWFVRHSDSVLVAASFGQKYDHFSLLCKQMDL